MARKVSTKKTKIDTAKTNTTKAASPGTEAKTGHNTQTFLFSAPTAMSVQLVGDFTHWHEKPINLQKGTDGLWRATVELGPGAHHYRFLVDGQWRDDPECTLHAPNPFGGENMVREVAA